MPRKIETSDWVLLVYGAALSWGSRPLLASSDDMLRLFGILVELMSVIFWVLGIYRLARWARSRA